MSTIYTLNGKVLKNAANDKWLAKKEAPAGFVMNASNVASTGNNRACWESPTNPDPYNGNGKTIQVTIFEDITFEGIEPPLMLMYSNTSSPTQPGPTALSIPNNELTAGTRTYTLSNNNAVAGGYGTYLCAGAGNADINPTSTWLSKIEFRIID